MRQRCAEVYRIPGPHILCQEMSSNYDHNKKNRGFVLLQWRLKYCQQFMEPRLTLHYLSQGAQLRTFSSNLYGSNENRGSCKIKFRPRHKHQEDLRMPVVFVFGIKLIKSNFFTLCFMVFLLFW